MGEKDKKKLRTLAKDSSNALLEYLKNYGEQEFTQSHKEALLDPQIKNISLALTQELDRSSEGTLFDIGCGEGILLRRLIEIPEFKNKKWIYFCTDREEKISDVLTLAADFKVHRRCEAVSLGQFYSTWPDTEIAPRPYIGMIRNLFHELDIDQTTQLLYHVSAKFQTNDVLFIQDLAVFPASERGNACWTHYNFRRLLNAIGFSVICTPEVTFKGNNWFSIIARRSNASPKTYNDINQIVLNERKKQYEYWTKLGWLAQDDEKYRDVRLAKIDFDLQCAALHQQLIKANKGIVQPLTAEQQSQIVKKTFSKYLDTYNPNASLQFLKPVTEPKCENRRAQLDWLEDFLRDPKPAVAILKGGPLTGKTTVVQKVLSTRAYEKKVIVLDVQFTSSIWNLIERFLTEIGCKISYEIFGSLKKFSFADIRDNIRRFILNYNDKIIIVVDHFERLLNLNGDISDEEIRDFFSILVEGQHSKLIITTRRKPNLQFIDSEKLAKSAPPIGRLPEVPDREHIYVEHILDDYNNRTKLGIDKYPDELLKAIDNHPHLAVIVALIIRKEGSVSLADSEFINLVKNKLRDELLQRIIDDKSRPIIEILSLLRIPVPRKMLESLTSKECVQTAEEDCLIYNIFDNLRDDLFAIIGPLKKQAADEDFESVEEFEKLDKGVETHKRIAHWYAQLHREDSDSRWLRELHYHTIASSDYKKLEEFGLVYKSEIFSAGNYWFERLKKYDEALWAFETVHKLGLKTNFTEMRLAACLMRVRQSGKVKEGEALYNDLIQRYPAWNGVKTSYIDSLLFLKRYQDALNKLIDYKFPENSNDSWIIHEYGRAYLGLHRYKEAIKAFEHQLKINTEAFVYDMLARSYHKIGGAENVERVLNSGLKRHQNNRRLKLTYASYLVRKGTTEHLKEAEPILEELYRAFPADGRVLQQYCKLLCHTDRVKDAENNWNKHRGKISPVEYKTPIHITILIGKKQWPAAIDELKDIPSTDEHLVGMKKKVYLAWARYEGDPNEQQHIAQEGLNINMAQSLENNIPLMVTTARLSRLAGDDNLYSKTVAKIRQINPVIADMLLHEDEALSYLEEDIF